MLSMVNGNIKIIMHTLGIENFNLFFYSSFTIHNVCINITSSNKLGIKGLCITS